MDEEQAIALLKKYAPDEKTFLIVYNHSKTVQKAALEIAKGKTVDREYIKVASLLHDIGHFRYPPGLGKETICHGIEGARILREEGYPEYAHICEAHIGIGLLKKDIIAQKLPLPKKDFLPETPEDMIITYADNLIFGDKIKTEKDVLERYEKALGKEYIKRMEAFNKKVKMLP